MPGLSAVGASPEGVAGIPAVHGGDGDGVSVIGNGKPAITAARRRRRFVGSDIAPGAAGRIELPHVAGGDPVRADAVAVGEQKVAVIVELSFRGKKARGGFTRNGGPRLAGVVAAEQMMVTRI